MAVYAAHLTRTVSGAPSVFSVAAQEALGATVKPALRKLVEYLAATYPNKCGWTVRWYDELYLVFDTCLQYHYLKHYAASFSESFYGLVRVPLQASSEFSSGVRLPPAAEKGALALLVLLPYVRDKVERAVMRWRDRDEDGQLGKSLSDEARRAAIKVYSIMHLIAEGVRLYHLASYLCGRGRSPTASLAFLGLTLKDAPPVDEEEYNWRDLMKSVITGNIGSAMVTFPMVGGLVLRGVQYGAFLVQFLRWWETRAPADSSLPPPPPPPLRSSEANPRIRNRCPICLQPWRVPTALPASGLVYCYSCISRHLRAHRACPVTRYPASEQALVRLYIDD